MEEVFEYLPQLIIAYNQTADLIHVKSAKQDEEYTCPCCGNPVKPRAINSKKEQSHYYHINGNCSTESQVHWFCKNWLFEVGSKFYVENDLYEVKSIEIEKRLQTRFGDYQPDIIVHTTTNQDIYFEICFTNSKRESNYFCKWEYLGNPVVEVELNQYQLKINQTDIPRFNYIYKDGICKCKAYKERDIYANTIAKRKIELTRQQYLNYKIRIEQLDYFWQIIYDEQSTHNEILDIVKDMDYEDQVFCYEIAKKTQCIKYLKDEIKDIINNSIIDKYVSKIKEANDIAPDTDNIKFGLYHHYGRTYEAAYIVDIHTSNININMPAGHFGYWNDTWQPKSNLNEINGFPKIVFEKSIYEFIDDDYIINQDKLSSAFNNAQEYIEKLYDDINKLNEISNIKYSINNNIINIKYLYDNNYIDIGQFDRNVYWNYIEDIKQRIEDKIKELQSYELINTALYQEQLLRLKEYNGKYKVDKNNIYIIIETNNHFKKDYYIKGTLKEIIDQILIDINEYNRKYKSYKLIIDKINNCKNGMWRIKQYDDRQSILYLYVPGEKHYLASTTIYMNEIDNIVNDMKYLMDIAELNKGIRFLEA